MIPLTELAQKVEGELIGSGDLMCAGANPPEHACADQITMLADPKHAEIAVASNACAIITSQKIETQQAQIIVSDPHSAFATIVAYFRPPIATSVPGVGIDSSARIAASAKVHPSATIGAETVVGERTIIMPGVVIMDRCQIGDDCVIMPNVTIYEYSEIDARVTIHAGSVIGAHGFGYRQVEGRHIPSAQLGYVHIESDVELGAGVTVDRGSYGPTTVGEGTKVDNQVMIAHNCQIGRHNLLCSQVGIAGSSSTGDQVILAGQVGLKDHVSVGDRAIIAAQSGVMNDCQGGETYLGSPATTQREQMQIIAITRRLPELRREIKKLRAELSELQKKTDAGEERRAA